jgi:hypothetical protein
MGRGAAAAARGAERGAKKAAADMEEEKATHSRIIMQWKTW